MNFFRDERGQATILIGMCIASLCGMAALSVDVGMLFRAKRIAQNAADAGAIAGAMEVPYSGWLAAAKAAAAQNGMSDGVNGVTVTVTNPSGTNVRVVVTQSAPTYFMKAFNITSMNVNATAVAALGPGSGCIFTLDQSGTDVGLTGNGNLTMPDCGIIVDSTSSNAVSISGNAGISAKYVGIVGGYSDTSNGGITPTPVTGIAPTSDPLAFETPPSYNPASCLSDPHPNGALTIGPAISGGTVCYNSLSLSGNAAVTMNPGVYVISGSFSASGNATITGSGITVYLAAPNGQVSLTGNGALNLTAPTSGTYNGILFYQDKSDTNTLSITGNGSSDIEGIFYAPSAKLNLTGNGGSTMYANLVVSALSITGNGNLRNYSGKNANTPLATPRLVQ